MYAAAGGARSSICVVGPVEDRILLGGWTVNSIYTVQSGMPVTVTQATNNTRMRGLRCSGRTLFIVRVCRARSGRRRSSSTRRRFRMRGRRLGLLRGIRCGDRRIAMWIWRW